MLTPVGYLQFENGVLYATDSPEFSKRLGVNQVTKLSINERMEVLALFEPFTHSSGAAVSGNRPGEVFAGTQAVILPGDDERPTISGQYLRRLYASPAPEFDLGPFVQSATILLSDDLGGFHFDVNGLVTEQQDDKTKARRAQFAQDALDLASDRQVHHLWRDMALHAAADARICGRESMVHIVFAAEKPRSRCGLRSTLDQYFHTVGRLCWCHLPSASTTVAPEKMKSSWPGAVSCTFP